MGRRAMLWPAGGDLTSWFVTVPVRSGVWLISEPGHVHSYLVAGKERAVLIDTGMGIKPIAPVARNLTNLPLCVVLTHNHYDHVGGAKDFERIAIHPDGVEGLRTGPSTKDLQSHIMEMPELLKRSVQMRELDTQGLNTLHPEQIMRPFPPGFTPDRYTIVPKEATETLDDGQLIDLGRRALEVIYTPGHSADSICLLEPSARLLFTADTVYQGALYAQLKDSDPQQYLTSLRRLEKEINKVDVLLPSHNRVPLDPPIIREMIAGFEQLLAGAAHVTGEDDFSGEHRRRARFGRFSVLLPP